MEYNETKNRNNRQTYKDLIGKYEINKGRVVQAYNEKKHFGGFIVEKYEYKRYIQMNNPFENTKREIDLLNKKIKIVSETQARERFKEKCNLFKSNNKKPYEKIFQAVN